MNLGGELDHGANLNRRTRTDLPFDTAGLTGYLQTLCRKAVASMIGQAPCQIETACPCFVFFFFGGAIQVRFCYMPAMEFLISQDSHLRLVCARRNMVVEATHL